jgi:hypothetical protein
MFDFDIIPHTLIIELLNIFLWLLMSTIYQELL